MARNIEDIFGGISLASRQAYFSTTTVGGETKITVNQDFINIYVFKNGKWQEPGKEYTIDGRDINFLNYVFVKGEVVSAVLNTRWAPEEYVGQFSQIVEFKSTGTETFYKPSFRFSSVFVFVDGYAWAPDVDYKSLNGQITYIKTMPANKQVYMVFNGAQGDLSSYESRQSATETRTYLDTKIDAHIPILFKSVDSESKMLALKAKLNDSCERTDINPKRIYFLAGDDPTKIGNWKPFTDLTNSVTSVNGRTGDVAVAEAGKNSDITQLTALNTALKLGADATALTEATSLDQVQKLLLAKITSVNKFTSVKNDTTVPASGSTNYGGEINSGYQVASADYGVAKMRVKTIIGGIMVPEFSIVDTRTSTTVNKAWPLPNVAGELVQTADSRLSTVDGKTGGTLSSALAIQGAGIRVSGPVAAVGNSASISWIGGTGTMDLVDNRGTGTGGIYLRIVTADNSSNVAVYNLQSNGVGLSDGGWQTASDERVKEDIEDIDPSYALDAVLNLRTVTFKMRDKPDGNGGWMKGDRSVGYLAQNLKQYLPEAVTQVENPSFPYRCKGDDGQIMQVDNLMSVDPGKAAAALNGAAIKALYSMIQELQEKVTSLQSEVEELKTK